MSDSKTTIVQNTTQDHGHGHSKSGDHHAVKIVKPKSIQIQKVNDNQLSFSTWMLLAGLILAFVILKTFIYIKDEKRHGK